MFSDKNKAVDAKWKIEIFKQEKKHITDFIIEFEILVMKANIDKLHAIFFLKKNMQADIIKMILEYLLIAVSEMLKEWKVTITSVSQGYKSTKGKQDYRMGTEMTYRERSIPMDTRKAKNNFNKDKRPKCFNCNVYKHIVKDCRKPKKE